MYQRHFGLRELPFELTPNPRFLFLTDGHREALSNLEYGLFSAKATTLLVGEAGTGKTTLIAAALTSDRCRHVKVAYIRNPALTRQEFIETLARYFDLGERAAESKARMLDGLEAVLERRRARGEIVALIVDEAQALNHELLEEIRLLANMETATTKLLPVVLAGQPELAHRLNEPDLRQLKQRVALRCEIRAFSLQETAAYISSRISCAGGHAARLFTREAVVLIHEHSHGVPRTINVLCDNALVTGMALGRASVDSATVVEVCRDFDFRKTAGISGRDMGDGPGGGSPKVVAIGGGLRPDRSEA